MRKKVLNLLLGTVLMEDGEYYIRQILFDKQDFNTTCRSKNGKVILNGGQRPVSYDQRK